MNVSKVINQSKVRNQLDSPGRVWLARPKGNLGSSLVHQSSSSLQHVLLVIEKKLPKLGFYSPSVNYIDCAYRLAAKVRCKRTEKSWQSPSQFNSLNSERHNISTRGSSDVQVKLLLWYIPGGVANEYGVGCCLWASWVKSHIYHLTNYLPKTQCQQETVSDIRTILKINKQDSSIIC